MEEELPTCKGLLAIASIESRPSESGRGVMQALRWLVCLTDGDDLGSSRHLRMRLACQFEIQLAMRSSCPSCFSAGRPNQRGQLVSHMLAWDPGHTSWKQSDVSCFCLMLFARRPGIESASICPWISPGFPVLSGLCSNTGRAD